MKTTMSITDADGLTVSLCVSADADALQRCLGSSPGEEEVLHLSETFEKSLLEMPTVLLRARRKVLKNLLRSSYEILEKKVTKLKEKQNAA